MMFLRNAWYVAAWEREVGGAPYATTILGDHVAIYRGTDVDQPRNLAKSVTVE